MTENTRTSRGEERFDTALAAAARGRLLLTFEEAAEVLGIGRTTLYKLVWAGRITPVRIGRSVRFTCAELDAFVSSLVDDSR
jgi:excisionase family DNA binding protein